MNRASAILFLLVGILSTSNIQAQDVTGSVNSDGLIVLSGNVDLLALELKSASGSLIPLPDDIPLPFALLLTNTDEEVFLGIVGADNAISIDDGLVLNVGYSAGESFDLEGSWGGPIEGQEGTIAFAQPPPAPEPSSGLLAALSIFGLLAIRNRR